MTNILLIGYRGTGKSTVGRLLAARLGWAFVDADDEVERRAGKSIAEVFAEEGEPAFRDLEQQVVADLTERSQCVVSLGGGAVLREENRAAIARCVNEGGSVVWLTASASTIHARLQADAATAQRRPQLTQQGGLAEIEQLLREREPLYRACASFQLDTQSQSPEEIAAAIARRLPQRD